MKIQRKRILLPVRVVVALVVVIAVGGVWYALRPDSTGGVSPSVSSEDSMIALEGLPAISPQAPVRLRIDAIEVDAPIVPVGTEPDGAMAAPKTATDIGWYDRSAAMGSPKRAMLLSGHYGLEVPEVLRRLSELEKGDIFSIVGGKGAVAMYRVVETERRHRTEVNMDKAFRYGSGQEAVSIITCIGEFDSSVGTYDERHIVYALRAN